MQQAWSVKETSPSSTALLLLRFSGFSSFTQRLFSPLPELRFIIHSAPSKSVGLELMISSPNTLSPSWSRNPDTPLGQHQLLTDSLPEDSTTLITEVPAGLEARKVIAPSDSPKSESGVALILANKHSQEAIQKGTASDHLVKQLNWLAIAVCLSSVAVLLFTLSQ